MIKRNNKNLKELVTAIKNNRHELYNLCNDNKDLKAKYYGEYLAYIDIEALLDDNKFFDDMYQIYCNKQDELTNYQSNNF